MQEPSMVKTMFRIAQLYLLICSLLVASSSTRALAVPSPNPGHDLLVVFQ